MRIQSFIISMVLILAAFPFAGNAANWNPLSDTEQTTCYDAIGAIPCPDPGEAFYGQDAQYSGRRLAFQDNGDATVTDLNTGLMWQQFGDSDTTHTWQEAVEYCAQPHEGYSDWRLPEKLELQSLVDHVGGSAAVSAYFYSPVPGMYWSATTVVGGTYAGRGWAVFFYSGGGNDGEVNKSASGNVRCVRGGV